MNNLFLINEDERKRILGMHETATKKHYLSEQPTLDLGQPTQPEVGPPQPEVGPQNLQDTAGTIIKQGIGGDPYVYGKLGNDFYYAKASDGDNPNWVLATNQGAINSIKSKIYNEKVPVAKTVKAPVRTTAKKQPVKATSQKQPVKTTTKTTTKPKTTTTNVPGKDKFKLKRDVRTIDVDSTRVGNGRDMKIPKLKDKEITKKIKTKTPNTQPGATSWLRKRFPNIAQLLSGRELTPQDFTEDQKKALLSTIQNSQKRTKNQKSGSTTYGDYGSDVASTFQNEKGSPSNWDVIWNSVTNNDRFAMATLFGKFNWVKNSDSSYTIDDKYDFKNPHYENIAGVNRKSLEGKSLQQLRSEYDLGHYEAARVKGWVDYPEEIPGRAIPLKLTINPSELA